jgi:TonB-dependent receptor
VRAGARYSEQDIELRQSDFNWGNISEIWSGRTYNDGAPLLLVSGNPNSSLDAITAPLFGTAAFSNYQRGLEPGFGGPVPAYIGPAAEDYAGFEATFNTILDAIGGSPSGWTPLTGRAGVIEGTPFLPNEVGAIKRDNWAAYVRADFGSDESKPVVLSGNIGVRYVHTKRSVDSSLRVNSFDQFFPFANLCDPSFVPTDPAFQIPDFCNLDLDALENALGDGFALNRTVRKSYDEFLPSLNLKLDLPGDHVLRTAISRTLTRPGVDQLNERIGLQTVTGPSIPDGNGGTINPFAGFVGGPTGNANLNPQTSWNIDISWEWYFARTGSLTLAGFHKEIDDFIAFAPVAVDIPEDDVPPEFIANPLLNPLLRNTEVNSSKDASVTGFEFAYQQFYDFLPGFLSGLGAQFTYTYIDSQGVDNQLDPAIPSDDPPTARFDVDKGIFPRISKHNINAVALYEKGGVQARLAYNWRSEFQLTPRDVIFPFASIYQPATGQLDASLFFDVTDNFKLGVQAVNLTDDITETTQTVDESGLKAPRNFFRNDRRYTLILRANF